MPPVFGAIKVVDAASWIAAPVAATMLADLGADVVKVEAPVTGDPYRGLSSSPFHPKSAANYCWMVAGRNKRSLPLNLKTEAGRSVLRRLIEWCDVYITNQPLPMRRALGLTYEDLAPLNERMVFASLTAYGERGPEADREGFDGVAYWARSGLADLIRPPGSRPAAAVPGIGDHPSGVALYAGIVTALYRREQTGRGGHVQTSLLANGYWANACLGQAALVGADFSDWDKARAHPENYFTRIPYACADGRYIQLLMVRSEDERLRALNAISPDLATDPRFADPANRVVNASELVHLIGGVLKRAPAESWIERLHAAGVPANAVASVAELASDEQTIANEVLMASDPEDEASSWVINHPVRLEGSPGVGFSRPPRLGEHSGEILSMLGYSSEAIAGLRASGAA